MKYNVYVRKTNNLLVTFKFYDKKLENVFLKQFRKIKDVDVVQVAD